MPKCTKIHVHLAAGICPDPLGKLERSIRSPSYNQGAFLMALKKSPFADLAEFGSLKI